MNESFRTAYNAILRLGYVTDAGKTMFPSGEAIDREEALAAIRGLDAHLSPEWAELVSATESVATAAARWDAALNAYTEVTRRASDRT